MESEILQLLSDLEAIYGPLKRLEGTEGEASRNELYNLLHGYCERATNILAKNKANA